MVQDYLEHREKIFAKFVTITEELVASNCRDLPKRDWSLPDSNASNTGNNNNGVSQYMLDIVKGTTTLHRLLVQLLPPNQVQEIFTRIVALLNRVLPEHFAHVDANSLSSIGTQRILTDITHLVNSLRKVRGLRDRGRTLDRYFRDRLVLCVT